MKTLLRAFLLLLLLPTAFISAEQLPSRTRGLSADSVYQMGNLDDINLFNGNLTLTIPIGQAYPVSPQLSYRLALVYNSNVWDYEDPDTCLDGSGVSQNFNFPYPVASSNAGTGWSLHLGRLFAPNDAIYNKNNPNWLYVSPDGGQHNFYPKLHPTETAVTNVFYSLDGTYLRLDVRNSAAPILESPDGIRHTFSQSSGRYRLAEMKDRFDNWVRVAYSPTAWTVTDSQGRSHTLTQNAQGQITQVALAAFGGASAIYGLNYTTATLERHRFDWPCPPANPAYPETVVAPLLTGLTLPDSSTYAFTYDTADSNSASFSGAIRRAVLPTGGRIEWDYTTYVFSSQAPSIQESARNRQRGVGARRTYLTSSGGAVDGSWTYDYVEGITVTPPSGPFVVSCWHRMRVSDNLSKQVTESYFATAGGPDNWWYGLPYAPCDPDTSSTTFTAWTASNDHPYLSTRVYERQDNGTLTPIRSTYVIYDSDGRDAGNHQDRNHRVRYQKVVHHDDLDSLGAPHREETIHADFDGLGHYRSTSRRSSFGPEKIVATSFFPAGIYQLHPDNSSVIADSFTTPAIADEWLFGLSNGSTTTQGSLVSKRETCYDEETGFLERQRLLAGSSQQTKDVVIDFEEGNDFDGNGGFVVAERIYGGDVDSNASTGSLCGLSLSSPESVKRHSYRYGGLTRSAWVEPCNESQEILVAEEAEIDQSTGLPETVVESNGLEVILSYDTLGRLLAEVPEEGASRTHKYGLSPPDYEVRHCPQGTDLFCNTAQRLSDRYWSYDGLGRMISKALAYPGASGDAEPSVTFKIDGIGRKYEESTWGGAHKTEFKNFDVFGRERTLDPDGAPESHLTFRGDRLKSREVQIATSESSLQSVFTTEEHDHHGRLVAICDAGTAIWNGVATCTGQLTRYTYDQDDRLIKVCQNVNSSGVCGQERLFGWDGRGFLVSEKHPEIGAAGNGTLVYQRDARGNMTSRDIASDTGDRPLRFTYDAAGRAIKVEEQISSGFRVLKEFFFARETIAGNSERRRGQLVMARRTNWVAALDPLLVEGGAPLVVTDHYQYGGLGGRVSKKTTSISLPSGGQSFASEYTYGPLGDIATIDYPSGDWPYEPTPARSVTYERHLGFLTEIPGYAPAMTYQLGGMLYEIEYGNGVRWRQTPEAATGWERPDKIETFNPGNTLIWSTGDYEYDGAGNITDIGDRTYVYDPFSRLSYAHKAGQTQHEQQATYDAYGNLIALAKSGNTRALTTNAATNRLAISGTSYISNGEMATARIDGADFTYGYDGLGQQLFLQSDTKTWIYAYDANDERILSWECVFDRCGDNTSFERYTLRGLGGEMLRAFEGKNRASIAWKEDYVYREGQPLAWIKAPAEGSGETYQYLHADHLGSTRQITSAAGAQVSRHDFLPFGEESTTVTGGDVELKFTGHERDQPGKPHDFMKARFYSPVLGRFLRVDPAEASARPGIPQTWNRYGYVANNPIKYRDPNGETLRVAAGEGAGDLEKFLKTVATKPSGRAMISAIANNSKFVITLKNRVMTNVSETQAALNTGQSVSVTFGRTVPTENVTTGKTIEASIHIDVASVAAFHPDPSGVTTTSHELYHATGYMIGLPWAVVKIGDFPSSESGPASIFGKSILDEEPDLSEQEASSFIENILKPQEQQH